MMGMHRLLSFTIALLFSQSLYSQSQFKSSAAGAPPAELGSAIQGVLNASGTRIMTEQGAPILEIWFRSSLPTGSSVQEEHVTLPMIPKGALVGAMRVMGPATDARGQALAPGMYTLRYALSPDNAGHKTVAPQRNDLRRVVHKVDLSDAGQVVDHVMVYCLGDLVRVRDRRRAINRHSQRDV